jgi:two-component system LytT family sensor kinase
LKISTNHKLIGYHLGFWLIYIVFYKFIEFFSSSGGYDFNLIGTLCAQLSNISIVYLSVYLYAKYTLPVRIVPLIIGIILIYLLYFGLWYMVAYHIRPFLRTYPSPPFQLRYFSAAIGWEFIKFSFFGFGYAYARKVMKHEKRLVLIETQKLEAEYAFLRAQINPHFLTNTLNFFHTKSLPVSDELSDGIMTLSQIMDYSLRKDDENRMVMLSDELKHVYNVVKINQLRFSNRLQIDLKIESILSSVQIVPLIIITVVENILKHGDCTLAQDPAKVHLFVSSDGRFIQLNTYNRKKSWSTEVSNGIGVENIKKRLYHHYGNSYELIIDDNPDDYKLKLKLPVFHKTGA